MLCAACIEKTASAQSLVFQHFPGREDVGILCWAIPEDGAGYLSQIIVFETDRRAIATRLWQSSIDSSYYPEIRFIPEIRVQGLPLALVQRQTGAASSQLDVIGIAAGRMGRLIHFDGFQFDVVSLDGAKLPFIVAHRDASILDVPEIYRWNGSTFVEDSSSHPVYYRELLAQDKAKLRPDADAVVLVNLSRIAVLSGDRSVARSILEDALSRERNKGNGANMESLRLISKALRDLTRSSPHPHAQTK